jgi:hypothetical protein
MSGYPERFDLHLNREIPLMRKPFTAEALLKRIRGILDDCGQNDGGQNDGGQDDGGQDDCGQDGHRQNDYMQDSYRRRATGS